MPATVVVARPNSNRCSKYATVAVIPPCCRRRTVRSPADGDDDGDRRPVEQFSQARIQMASTGTDLDANRTAFDPGGPWQQVDLAASHTLADAQVRRVVRPRRHCRTDAGCGTPSPPGGRPGT